MKSINPATEQVIATYESHSESDVESKLSVAQQAFAQWRKTDLGERATLMLRVAAVLRDGRDRVCSADDR